MAMTTADPSTWGWQPSGFAVPTLQNCIEHLIGIYEREASTTLLRDPTNPIYVLITAAAEQHQSAMELLRGLVDSLDPLQAEGAALDVLARINGVNRLGSARTTCTLRVAGVAGTAVPRGFRASGASGTFVVETVVAAVVGSGGTVDVAAQCTAVGPQTVGAIGAIVTPFIGINSVSLVADSMTAGRNVETDRELRVRMLTDRASRGRGTRDAIEAAVRAAPGVEAATVYENLSDRAETVAGFLSPPHSVQAVIYGTVAPEVMGAVLASQVGAGIETAGDETYDQTIAPGVTKTWRWRVATEVPVQVRITGLAVTSGSPSLLHDAIKAAVAGYVNGLEVGEDVVLMRVIQAMLTVPGVEFAASIELSRGSFVSTNLTIAATEKATVSLPSGVTFVS